MTLHGLSITSCWIFLSAFALAETPAFALGSVLATIEYLIIFRVGHVRQELIPLFAFAVVLAPGFAFALDLDEVADPAGWSAHVLAPVPLGPVVLCKEVLIHLHWCHVFQTCVVRFAVIRCGLGV